jgi:short-subunit dehydrogenase
MPAPDPSGGFAADDATANEPGQGENSEEERAMNATASTQPVALVTGASGGIGRALAGLFARDRWDVVLVARDAAKLKDVAQELEGRHGVTCTVLPADLADPGAPDAIVRALEERGLVIEALVNNAGFGLRGAFDQTDLRRELEMIQLNVVALTSLTKHFLRGMLSRGRGKILNLASVAGFVPGPGMAVYYATKAYVLSFSEALAEEVGGRGVTVTALCPGPTRTAFGASSGADETNLFKTPNVMDVEPVARAGYDALMSGKRVVVPGFFNKVLIQSLRVSPRRMIAGIAKSLNA